MSTPKSKTPTFYLFATAGEQQGSVFYKVDGEQMAKLLCSLCTKKYAIEGHPSFLYKASALVPIEERVLLDEALDWLETYSDPDPGIYDPEPSREMHLLAQYKVRASQWEEISKPQMEAFKTTPQTGEASAEATFTESGSRTEMPPEDWRNASLILLMMLAQAYYKVLESTISMATWFVALDLELNESYFWTVKNITNLLKNNEAFKDFPIPFEPIFPDLYPSTIKDVEWEDVVAPRADEFLRTVHQYVHSYGTYDPDEGTPAWIFLELFRPSINAAIQRAADYRQRMDAERKRLFSPRPQPSADKPSTSPGAKPNVNAKRFKIAFSFPGERRPFIEQVATHLLPKIGRDKLLYDKYYESEFARPDLDTYLQGLYHDESELIAVFLCRDYESKEWCGLEWRSLRDLIKKRKGSRIMLFRFDHTEISGIFSIDGYIEIGERSSDEIANCILERLRVETEV